MKKKEESEHESEAKNDRWLLTYSDMITLLLALFIILYSMSNIENSKLQAIAKAFSHVFGTGSSTASEVGAGTGSGIGMGDASSIASAIASSTTTSTSTSSSSINSSSTSSGSSDFVPTGPLGEVYKELYQYIKDNHLQSDIGLSGTDSYITLNLKGMFMFQPDSDILLNSSKPVIDEIGKALMKVYDVADEITITGHTADVGEHTTMTDEVSWKLSIERADTVRESFVKLGMKEDKISLGGNAHYKPIASNNTEAGRAQNRRVEITVWKSTPAKTTSASSNTAASSSKTTSAASGKNGASSSH